eukprot:CAMPEP_0194162246 /NCGR_PEP_ID=MMETSP0152-20130528/79394_1 /TAXON_ID=1049557 /ORGANISM="Thalassiothrix antarctica, Strain L6-D1" /LENGTH=306 /DNA_ID=CAMNT_0038872133 /DNA_START=715 /DNA_END=1635 /DNA_ORIENTATION=-
MHIESYNVIGDKMRLTQVIRNLLSNAIKFTPEGGSVTVSARWIKEDVKNSKYIKRKIKTIETSNGRTVPCTPEGQIEVTVSDTGAGMTLDQLNHLFEDGVQFNVNRLQCGQGSGLGLFIAKGIVKQHGGTLKAESAGLGKGATFSLTLPVYKIPEEEETAILEEASKYECNNQKDELKLLVVDDSKMNRKLLMRLLQNHGHACIEASDGQDAIEKVTEAEKNYAPFDTILMDSEMPIMNGPDAAAKIREMGNLTFIVGLTGNVLPEDIKHFKSCGANAVLPKPFVFTDLEDLWSNAGLIRKASLIS